MADELHPEPAEPAPQPASAGTPETPRTEAGRVRSQCGFYKKRAWDAPLDDHGRAYFNILAADYAAMTPAPPQTAANAAPDPRTIEIKEACAQIRILLDRPADEITWSELLILEASLGKLWSMERLSRELALVRAEYKEMIGLEAYAALQLPAISFADGAENRSLRAEYQTLLRELHWSYISAPAKEHHRGRFLIWLTTSLAMLLFGLFFVSYVCSGEDPVPERVFSAVITCGAIGAWLSAYQRLQSPGSKTIILLNLRRTKLAGLSFFLSPWIGALCAVVLSLIFAGGIINGKFFPTVRYSDHLDAESTNMLRSAAPAPATPTNSVVKTNAGSTTPEQAKTAGNKAPLEWHLPGSQKWYFGGDTEYALLLVWAFVAGFSERLVPDLLSRIAKKTEGAA